MEMPVSQAIKDRVQLIFQDLFDDTSLQINNQTTADDIEAWDSLTHIDMIVAVEKAFKIKFSTAEVTGMKNVGELISLIERKGS
jgi:acyl carrier protein